MDPLATYGADYKEWLEKNSMLPRAEELVRGVRSSFMLGSSSNPQGEKWLGKASTWISIYPNAVIPYPNETVFATLRRLLKSGALQDLGIKAIYMTPINRSGGVKGRNYTPSTDGNFDPISFEIDDIFGSSCEHLKMIDDMGEDILLIRNLVPLHTGQGPDFLLALLGHEKYQNLYMMTEILECHWDLLPDVPTSASDWPVPSAQVEKDKAEKLTELKYIPGVIRSADATVYANLMSGWSATDVITGIDGRKRRWVYMHFFKPSQPALNHDHPDCEANRLINGDAISTMGRTENQCRTKGLRLDAIPFSVEEEEEEPVFAERWGYNTPSAIRKANQHASLIRRLKGFSFQELMAPLQEVKKFMEFGTDLTYDFFTRASYLHAILTGNAALLRMAFRQLDKAEIQTKLLVHDLQNHDELTYQLPELMDQDDEPLVYGDKPLRKRRLRVVILKEMQAKAAGDKAPWNLLFRTQNEGGDGIATTMVGFIAAGLGINPYEATDEQREQIKRAHLLVAIANAMQPGVFSLSMWDLVGALPLCEEVVKNRNDSRWVNRGGVDLLGANPDEEATSVIGLPRARSLYGPLPGQLMDKTSFASQLSRILATRDKYKIALGELASPPPDPDNPGVCLLAMRLPGQVKEQLAVTALNFGRESAEEEFDLVKLFKVRIHAQRITDEIGGERVGTVSRTGRMTLKLDAIQGMTFLIRQ